MALVLGLCGGAGGALLVDQAQRDAAESPDSQVHAPVIEPGPVSHAGGTSSPVEAVADAVLPSVVSIEVHGLKLGVTGSGFMYDEDGHVVTNNHVIEPAVGGGEIRVSLPDGATTSATIVGRSPSYDIAVIQLDDSGHTVPATLGSSADVQVGQRVVAFGSPLGLNATVTSGIISATHRPVTAGGHGETSYINALQTDAAINPGNSGGPLVDLSARVVGVNSAIATVTPNASESGNIGVGFSIPIDQVVRTVKQIVTTGHAVYPVIGAEVSVRHGIGGAELRDVTDGSPADQAGLRPGDLVEKIDGEAVDDGIELIVQIRAHRPGETVTLEYQRGGDESTVDVALGKKVG
ncbi:MAG: S1C family serine protease [Nocardioidaceae bacterium]